MSSYTALKKASLENPKIRAAYEELQPEFHSIQAMIDAEKNLNMTQEELSGTTDIKQTDHI